MANTAAVPGPRRDWPRHVQLFVQLLNPSKTHTNRLRNTGMSSRRLNVGVPVTGLLLAASPLYWDVLHRLGVTGYFDWLGTIGATQDGMYYVTVGLLYLSAGILTLRYTSEQKRTARRLYIGTSISLLVVWGILFLWRPSGMNIDPRSIAGAIAIGPVLVCLPMGVASDRSARRVGRRYRYRTADAVRWFDIGHCRCPRRACNTWWLLWCVLGCSPGHA